MSAQGRRRIRIGMLGIAIAAIVGSGYASASSADASSSGYMSEDQLSGLSAADEKAAHEDKMSQMRLVAIRQAAMTLGAQNGFAATAEQIDADLKARESTLNKVYDFKPLLIDNNRVLPPVILRADGSWSGSADQAKSADVEYSIYRAARIVPVAPVWENWLFITPPHSNKVEQELLPKTDVERAAWRQSVAAGWSAGTAQAKAEFDSRLNEITRDYLGMITFKKLLMQGMVSAPILADGHIGVVVRGKSLSINEKVFRLTAPANFQATQKWIATPY